LSIWGKSKLKIEEPTIILADHKKVVNQLIGGLVRTNIILAKWTEEVKEAAEKTKNPTTINFAKSSILNLKKKLAEELQKATEINGRI
jgi:hypothetical protein